MSDYIPVRHIYPDRNQPVSGVYVVMDGHGPPQLLKVGHSDDVVRRLAELKTGNARNLRLFGVLQGATEADERYLHRVLWRWRVPGTREWYNNCRPLWQEIMTFVRRMGIEIIILGRPQLDLFQPRPGQDGVPPM